MHIWKERCLAKTVPGQHHTPAATKEAPTHGIHESLMLMTAMHHSYSKNGVYYAGTLLAQHILLIGSAIQQARAPTP
eukprot:9264742-Ditylum_brightwellii.AAC.1